MHLLLRCTICLLLALWVIAVVVLAPLSAVAAPSYQGTSYQEASFQEETPPPTASPSPTPRGSGMGDGMEDGWLRLPELPDDATQADVGAEVYRLVCEACHGDQRQGLTDEWRATWSPETQNCWQSKCHAGNHPPEGFVLPRSVPPLGGPDALARFETAFDLHEYMSNNMPWHDPGSLTNEQYWQITAFLIREQGIAPMTTSLDPERAKSLRLHGDAPTATPDVTPATSQGEESGEAQRDAQGASTAGSDFWWSALAGLAAVAAFTIALLYRQIRAAG